MENAPGWVVLVVHECLDRFDAHLAERPGNEKLDGLPTDAPTAGVTNEPIAKIGDSCPSNHERGAPDGASCISLLDGERQSLVAFRTTLLALNERQASFTGEGIWKCRHPDEVGVL